MSASDEALVRETVRLYRRYAIEIVELFGFCPYAERARLEARSAEIVVLDETLDVPRGLRHVETLAADPKVEVAFLIFPLVRVDRVELGRFVERLRSEHQRRDGGLVLTMEGFHPEGALDASSTGRVVPFLRRTPDPTIQLTRLSVLQHVRRATPSGTGYVDPLRIDLRTLLSQPAEVAVSDRIAQTNLETVRARSAEIARVIEEIHDDHRRTRATLGR
jgi:hypothetical protein